MDGGRVRSKREKMRRRGGVAREVPIPCHEKTGKEVVLCLVCGQIEQDSRLAHTPLIPGGVGRKKKSGTFILSKRKKKRGKKN